MARDKLITIRIEGEKRKAFGELAKSQNTDTASLLYDFILGCLDGRIDIKLVTGKGNRLGNQIDSDRLDKLETTTQRLDHWIGALSERVNDWILRSDRRVNDCEKELSEKMVSLEHRLNALAMQLDSQQDSQQLDSIDTDSQQIDDMEPLLKRERESSIASPIPTIEETSPLPPSPSLPPDEPGDGGDGDTPEVPPSPPSPALEAIEDSEKKITLLDTSIASPIPTGEPSPLPPSPPDRPAIETLPTVETVSTDSSIETVASAIESVTDSKPWYTIDDLLDCHYPGWPETKEGLRKKAKREHWPKRTRRGSKGNPYEYQAVLPE